MPWFSSFRYRCGDASSLERDRARAGHCECEAAARRGLWNRIIGVCLAASCPTWMSSCRDAISARCPFPARNAARNGLAVELRGLGGARLEPCRKRSFSKIKVAERNAVPVIAEAGLLCEPDGRGPYDVVLSNLPAKAGPLVLAQYFSTVRAELLRDGGIFAFVIVTPLAEQARAWCAEAGFSLRRTVSTKNHMVAIAQVPEGSSTASPGAASGRWFSRYVRSHVEKRIAGAPLAWDGIQGLSEFDEPSSHDCGFRLLGRSSRLWCDGSL